jgi:tetratricopeptide (TPR) repeat protein
MLGRSAELDEIAAARARGGRIITLVGRDGAGKTTLARAYLARGGKALTVELGRHRSPQASIARALGLDGLGVARLAGALDALGPIEVLLDRADLALDAVAAWLPELLESAPEVAWLVTSRAPLGVAGEIAIAVSGLDDASAMALVRRYPIARTSDDELARIVRSTSGIPLALQLVAGRLAREPLTHVARELEAIGGEVPLHETIARAIDALDAESRSALASLSVFEGRFGHDASDAVIGAGAREKIAALRDRALIQRAGGGHVLHDEIRTAARTLGEDLDAARRRLEGWLAAEAPRWAHAIHEGDPSAALRALTTHEDDLMAALASTREDDPGAAAKIALGLDAWLLTHTTEATHAELMELGAEAAERSGELGLVIEHARARARALFLRGRIADARAVCTEAMRRAHSGGDRRSALAVTQIASAIAREMGDPGAARALAERALAESRALGDLEAEARATHNLACAMTAAGELASGRTLFLAALAIARDRSARRVEALCLANLAIVHERLGEHELARARGAQAITAFAAQGDRMMLTKIAIHDARRALASGHLEEAERAMALAAPDGEQLGDRDVRIEVHLLRAELALARRRPVLARAEAEEAMALARYVRAGAAFGEIERILAAIPEHDDRARRTLAVSDEGATFALDEGAEVDLSRRPSLQRILALLASRAPAIASIDDLIAAGWPAEKMSPESGTERVYTAIATLRRLGLAPVLRHREGGYALDPELTITQL